MSWTHTASVPYGPTITVEEDGDAFVATCFDPHVAARSTSAAAAAIKLWLVLERVRAETEGS